MVWQGLKDLLHQPFQIDHLQIRLQEQFAAEPVDQDDLVVPRCVPHLGKEANQVVERHAEAPLLPDGQEPPLLPDQLGSCLPGKAVEGIEVHTGTYGRGKARVVFGQG